MKDLRTYTRNPRQVHAAMAKANELIGLYEEDGSYMICTILLAIWEEATGTVATGAVTSGEAATGVPSTREPSSAVAATCEAASGDAASVLPPASNTASTVYPVLKRGARTSTRLQLKKRRSPGASTETKKPGRA